MPQLAEQQTGQKVLFGGGRSSKQILEQPRFDRGRSAPRRGGNPDECSVDILELERRLDGGRDRPGVGDHSDGDADTSLAR